MSVDQPIGDNQAATVKVNTMGVASNGCSDYQKMLKYAYHHADCEYAR
jgi:hypothetical protein